MIKQNPKYKLALVSDCLAGGGAERVHARLSEFFTAEGIDVHNCVFADRVAYTYAGSLLNLGKIASGSPGPWRKIRRFLAFRKFIRRNNFDAVIDFRMRTSAIQEMLLSKLAYEKGAIYSIRSGHLDFYFPKPRYLSKLIYRDKRVNTVSSKIRQRIMECKLATDIGVIYNPVTFDWAPDMTTSDNAPGGKYILAAGRMNDDIKQFDQLIIAYSKSGLPKAGVHLVLIGEGGNLESYKELATSLGLSSMVSFKGFVTHPRQYYREAIYTVLCSRNEGFPNVLAESLSCGTPVISFDCFSGPSEIIIHRHNGLLVNDQDFSALTAAMDEMIRNTELYVVCKNNAVDSVGHLSIDNIGRQWLEYLKFT